MRKYTLGDHPEITLNFYADAKSFSAGAKFDMPDLKERIKKIDRKNDKIIVIGEDHTKCSITTSDVLLDRMQIILKDYIRSPIGNIENIEID